jgi:glycosyltransferase involved in cell wall biosynthesis
MGLLIADSHEFLELYRGDKDLRLGVEMLALRDDMRFVSLAPSAASPNDRTRFGIRRVLEGPVPTLPHGFRLSLQPSLALRFQKKESGGIVSFMPGYGRALRRMSPDVLFENPYTWLTPRSYQSYLASRREGFPVIYYDPGDDIPVNWRQKVLQPLERPIVNHARRIITYNEAGKQRFVRKYGYPSHRIHVIPKPVDVSSCTYSGSIDELRKSLTNAADDSFVVTFLGRLTKYRSSRVLLDVAGAAESDPVLARCRFVFVGGALSADECEQDYMRPNTHVTGMVAHDEVSMYLKASDVVVFPDITNPGSFTTAMAEAMAAGAPLIVGTGSRSDLVPLVNDVSALLVATSDPLAIAEALRQLIDNPEVKRSLGRNVAAYAREFMDYPRVASKYLTIVDEVLAETVQAGDSVRGQGRVRAGG